MCYTDKEAAVNALVDNLDSEEFPGVNTVPACSQGDCGKGE